LAKLQCVSSGIPITTGISTIDYYLSCRSFEPEQAQQNYSEKLVSLPNPPWQVEVPALSTPLLNRADLGLPPDKTLYLFPHTLFRLDPDLDPIVAALLSADPQAVLVLLRYRETRLHEDLQKRLGKILSATDLERICFLPWLPQPQFLQLLNLADLALDGLYLGGGLVSYQCFAQGLPIIHLPTDQLRCRVAAGLYNMAGLSEWIAQDKADYLHKALQLGQDPALRSQLKSQIRAARPLIFENRQGPKDLAAFFLAQF
jgi:CRISPR-associated protein Csy1